MSIQIVKFHLRSDKFSFLNDTETSISLYGKLRRRLSTKCSAANDSSTTSSSTKISPSIMLESADSRGAENARSIIATDELSSFRIYKVQDKFRVCYSCNGFPAISAGCPESLTIRANGEPKVQEALVDKDAALNYFIQYLGSVTTDDNVGGFFGFLAHEAVTLFEDITLKNQSELDTPILAYAFYTKIFILNNFNAIGEVIVLGEPTQDGLAGSAEEFYRQVTAAPFECGEFQAVGEEQFHYTAEEFTEKVKVAKSHVKRGDVFQIVISRRFMQRYQGDVFALYRQLRSINPSPYLFIADFSDFVLLGSSPEAQLLINDGECTINPIAGTIKRSSSKDVDEDKLLAAKLAGDPKENAEHVMLVDLARNDLNRHTRDVRVDKFKEIHYFSHVIHIVSVVKGLLDNPAIADTVKIVGDTFPAGTLSGAPKYRAMQLIDELEEHARDFYGGALGFWGLDGSFNHAIIIRSFLAKDDRLYYQAGAGVVDLSVPESEGAEVLSKLGALKAAIRQATHSRQ